MTAHSPTVTTALHCYETGDDATAAAICRQLLAVQPDRLDALMLLGGVAFRQRDWQGAIALYERILRRYPRCWTAYENLGRTLQACDRLDEAAACYERAIAQDGGRADWHYHLGCADWERGRLDRAIASFDRALQRQPDWEEARSTRGLVRLLAGDWRRGWADYEARPARRDLARSFPRGDRLWKGEDVRGKTLLLLGEQGFGDAIQFARYLPELAARGARVWLRVRSPLVRLFEGLAGCDRRFSTTDPIPAWDAHALLMSLPHLLQIPEPQGASVPYLRVAPNAAPISLRDGVGDLPNVGLVWSGSPGHRKDGDRSCTLAQFQPWLALSGLRFYSLQKDPRPEDAARLRGDRRIVDLAPDLGDFRDTAAIVQHLDLVVTVDTAVAHLAGALGKPTWLLLARVPDWRWGMTGDRSPWYPTMRLFRQSRRGDWSDVLAAVERSLVQLARSARSPVWF